MRVIHVVPAVVRSGGGPSYSVPALCEALRNAGVDTCLATLNWPDTPPPSPSLLAFPFGLGPRRLGGSPALRRWLQEEMTLGRAQVVHGHGLWMMPNVYPGWVRGRGHGKLMVSPRGALSAHALGRNDLQKKIFWRALQAQTLERADCFHATAESELEDIRRLGFRQPICLLPNGIEVPPLPPTQKRKKQVLFLGRIHPIKGVDVLLRAWQSVQARFQDWELLIAGPDNEGHATTMQALAKELGLQRVTFGGPCYGADKERTFREASIYVLPTHSENFGITVAEALAAGTPAIVTQGAPWGGLKVHGAGWWIEQNVPELAACLDLAMSTPPAQLSAMGMAGREWMLRDYSWPQLGQQLAEVYAWLTGGGNCPTCVHRA